MLVFRAHVVMLVALACTATASADFVVPWWSGTTVGSTDGNPYTDGDGNTWGLYQVTFGEYLAPASYDSLHLMNWTSVGGNHWTGPTGNTEMPGYYEGPALAGLSSGTYAGTLRYTPDQAGTYSWTGTLTGNGYGNNDVYLLFTKLGTTTGTLLHEQHMTNGQNLDLGIISPLQDISLGSGESLALLVTTTQGGYSGANLSNVAIGYVPVPEPSSICLLAVSIIGLLAYAWRKHK